MKKDIAAIAVIATLVLVGFGSWYFTSSSTTYSGTPESITIGKMPIEAHTLIYIAEDQGYFAENGLNVIVRDDYPNGVVPISDMLNDKIDISVSAEYPVVWRCSGKKNFR